MVLGRWMQMAAVVGALAACGGNDNDDDQPGNMDHPDAGPPAVDAGPAKLTLEVASAAQIQRIGFTRPTSDNRFIGVTLTLTNTGEAEPLAVDMTTLSLETADLLLYPRSAASPQAPMACPIAVGVEAGGKLSCQVTFEIPYTTAPKGLVYADSTNRSGRANIATLLPPTVLCDGWPNGRSGCRDCVTATVVCAVEKARVTTVCAAEGEQGCLIPNACPGIRGDCTSSLACQVALDVYQGCLYDSCRNLCL